MTATEEAYPIAPQVVRGEGAAARPRQARARRPVRADRRGARVHAGRRRSTSSTRRSARFAPRLAEIFRSCIDAGHVDVLPRPGKAAGAYCTSVSKTILPYVLMNYTERLRDVSTLAHEFGHATHNVIALERQTWRSHRCGIPMAEVPSTFAQSIADDYLLENETDPGTRAALAADRLENAFAAIYRQTVLARFEQRAYGLRAEGLSLGAERLNELWVEENAQVLRRCARDARGLRARVVVHPALHPRPLLHVRVLVRTARRAAALPPLPRGPRGVRSEVPRAARARAAPPRRPTSSRRSGSTSARPTPGAKRSQSWTPCAKKPRRSGDAGRAVAFAPCARPAAPAALPRLRRGGNASLRGCRARLPPLTPPLCARCGAPTAWPVARCRECAGRRLAFATRARGGGLRRRRPQDRSRLEGARPARARRRGGRASSPSGCRAPTSSSSPSCRPTRERRLERGYHPAEQLARALAERLAAAVRAAAHAGAAARAGSAGSRSPSGAGTSRDAFAAAARPRARFCSSTTSTRPAPPRMPPPRRFAPAGRASRS